ncbi:hypothetical protein ACHQM5_001779 [Ranunculus cassubicifolius]
MSQVPMASQEDDKKPFINLKIKHKDESVMHFRVRFNMKLEKLMNMYCEKKGVEHKAFRFLFDGQHIKGHQTPNELEMEDGDEIDAMLPQFGGFIF